MRIYLPGRVVLPEVRKSRLKPTVDIAQSELVVGRLNYRLKEQVGVGVEAISRFLKGFS